MTKEKTSAWVRVATTKAGRMALAASEAGLVLTTLPDRAELSAATAGEDDGTLSQRVSSPGRRVPARRVRAEDAPGAVGAVLDTAERALVGYYAAWPECPGKRILSLWEALASLPIELNGLPQFTRTVLELLRQVPPGEVVTYGELAARAGSPKAARAVGSVMARNPLPIIIPCHRVVAAGGGLGGFAGDTKGEALALKESLLRYEGWDPLARSGMTSSGHPLQ